MLEGTLCLALTEPLSVSSASDTMEELLGFPSDDFITGQVSLKDLLHPHDIDIADMLFSRNAHPASGSFNIRIRQANGRIRCVRGSFEKRSDKGGTAVVLDLLLQDAKSLGRTLDEAVSMPNFCAMMDNTDDYIYFKDSNHVFTGASQTLVSLCDPAEHWMDLIGQTDYDVFAEEYADIYYNLEKQVFTGIAVAHEIQETLTKDGKKGWVDNRKYPIKNKNGDIIGLYGIARDITLLKRSEEELLQNEKRLEEAQRIASIGSWELDLLNNALKWSDEIFHIFEIDQEHLAPSYTAFLASIHPEDRDRVNEAYTESLVTREPYKVSHRLLMSDGRVKHVLEQCETNFSPDGKPLRSIGTVQDITERKIAENTLAESQSLLHGIIESTADFIWSVDPVLFGLRSYNDSLSEYFITKRSFRIEIGMRPEDLYPPGEIVHTWHDYYKRALDEEHFIVEYATYAGGSTLELNFNLLKNDGKVFGISVFGKDITEQKRANQTLRQMLQLTTLLAELSTQFLNVTAPELDQTISDAQRRICNLLELDISTIFQPLSESQPGLKITHVYRDPAQPTLPETLSGGESFPWSEQQILSGTVVKVNSMKNLPIEAARDKESWNHYGIKSSLAFPLIDKGSRVLGTLSFAIIREEFLWPEEVVKQLQLAAQLFANVLARKHAEADKIKLEAQLHQAQRMESIGNLAGGVAHDFNNKLTVILGCIYLADSEIDTVKIQGYMEEIRKAAEQSADLTRQLLAFARKQTIAPKVLDLNETVSGMLKMLQRLIGEDINLNWHPAPNLWEVKLDPSQIDQILANLCVNARDSIADVGKITIETGRSVIDEEYCSQNAGFVAGEYVRLSISDDGCGMDKKTLAQIFEPFFTTKGLGEGTGLGLSTVYGIVRQNKGRINVYSEPGLGTTFTIYLPRHAGTSGKAQAKEVVEPAKCGRETILLVEDDPAILDITTMILAKQGYNVLAANSPGEALNLASEHANEIHLLMTDVVMPGMNGRDLAKKLQSQHQNIKCLYMSGYTANVIAHHGVLDTGLHFIQKPFSMNLLADKLREVLDSHTHG